TCSTSTTSWESSRAPSLRSGSWTTACCGGRPKASELECVQIGTPESPSNRHLSRCRSRLLPHSFVPSTHKSGGGTDPNESGSAVEVLWSLGWRCLGGLARLHVGDRGSPPEPGGVVAGRGARGPGLQL